MDRFPAPSWSALKAGAAALFVACLFLAPPSAAAEPASETSCGNSCRWIALSEESPTLQARLWLPSGKPRGSLVFVHGVKSHSGWFGPLAQALTKHGFAVIAADRRGSGVHRGLEGGSDPKTWIGDVNRVFRRAQTYGSVGLVGWCWGARVALRAIQDGLAPAKLFLLVPALRVSPVVRANVEAASRQPGSIIPLPFGDDMFSDDPTVLRYIKGDRSAWTSEPRSFLSATRDLANSIEGQERKLTVPTYVLLAETDRITDNEATRALLDGVRSVQIGQMRGGHAVILEDPVGVARRIAEHWTLVSPAPEAPAGSRPIARPLAPHQLGVAP